MSNDKHIEAAAAAYVRHMAADWKADPNMRQLAAMEAAVTAHCESLASAGDEGVVEAMIAAFNERTVPIDGQFYGWVKDSMRAALAVARLSMGEVERDAARWRWLSTHPEHPLFPTFSMSFDTLDEACDAAREKEAASYE